MHRRFLKSLATVMGAAALVVAPMALIAPSAQAAVVTANEDNSNDPAYWVKWLFDEEGITAICVKDEPVDDPYIVPEIDDRFAGVDGYDSEKSYEYVLAVVKGGSGPDENELFWYPEAGDELSHPSAGNSHVILCISVVTETSPPPSTTPPASTPPASTPPVVDTDRVSTGSGANLGLYGAAAALLVGAAAIVAGRRRQGAHR